MLKFNKTAKVILFNLGFIGLILVSGELLIRYKFFSKVEVNKPLASLKSITLALMNKGSSWDHHLNQSNKLRYPYPYIMFKGKPNALDHNRDGYRISDPITTKTINIALFGGSTGYGGNPPIINLITNKLNNKYENKKFAPLNFSVVSSNHNQHIHSILQNSDKYPIDLIIFYGGYNESLQTAFYDPRPGFPYNFKERNELSPLQMLIKKHSVLLQFLEAKYFPNEDKRRVWSDEWSSDIVLNYSSTLEKARKLSKVFTTGRCKKPFLFIFQPFQLDESKGVKNSYVKNVHKPFSKIASQAEDGIDISDVFKSSRDYYIDLSHLNQDGKEIISEAIIKNQKFQEFINSCSLKQF